jgi:hypothetical protein
MAYPTLLSDLLSAAMNSMPPVLPQGEVWGYDGLGYRFGFTNYDILACPAGLDAVYVFARREARIYVPLYVGRAEFLSRRLPGHERRDEAISLGASHLLVHIPGASVPIGYAEVERRLIRYYAPVLNEQHNALAALLRGN